MEEIELNLKLHILLVTTKFGFHNDYQRLIRKMVRFFHNVINLKDLKKESRGKINI